MKRTRLDIVSPFNIKGVQFALNVFSGNSRKRYRKNSSRIYFLFFN
jgi:hypothetical protein